MDDLDLGATIKGFIPGQKVFNRYKLTKILGRGGMGVVWLARDEDLERDVALKFLPEVVALDKEAVRDLKRETRRSLELTHAHIVRIHDFIQDARTAAISMEYVAGATLASLKVDRPQGHFEVKELRDWVQQWLEAMEYAHTQAKVAHRDLKPANLMIDSQGRLKVTDFGIAASMGETASRVSNQFGSSGTPVYMSPQQMMGEKPAVTDDIYAIGATMYELLTGKPPFYSGNVLMQVQNKVPPTMTERRTEFGLTGEPIPPAWETTIAACLAKEPQDRPQSALHIRKALLENSAVMPATQPAAPPTSRPVQVSAARPATSVRYETKPAGKKLSSGIWMAVGLAACGMVGAGGYYGLYKPRQAQREAEAHAAELARWAEEAKQREAELQRQTHTAILTEIQSLALDASQAEHDRVALDVREYLASAPAHLRRLAETQWNRRTADWTLAFRAAEKKRSQAEVRRLEALYREALGEIDRLSLMGGLTRLEALAATLPEKLRELDETRRQDVLQAVARKRLAMRETEERMRLESTEQLRRTEAERAYQEIIQRIEGLPTNATAVVVQQLDEAVVQYLSIETRAERGRAVAQQWSNRKSRWEDRPDRAYELSELDQPPVPRLRVQPIFPFELRRAGINGEVLVEFIVDTNGDVKNASAVRSTNPAFETPAIAAVMKWKFRPGRKDGRPVDIRIQQPLKFEISN